jgi:hypothetical protein
VNKFPGIKSVIKLCCFAIFPTLLFADTVLPTDPNIRYVGRFEMSDPLAPRMYWSGTRIIAWFEGTSCQVKLNCAGMTPLLGLPAGTDYFNIMIDDGTPVKYGLTAGPQTISAASGLADGVHKIELFKRTTYQYDNTAFEGFITDSGKGLAPLPPAPAVKIQFYGDSITDGCAVDASNNNNRDNYWNNYLTYAAVTARNLDMEYVCTAASGIGVRYVPHADSNLMMANYYDRIIPGGSSDAANQWDFSGDDTDIVVINLLENDFLELPSPNAAQSDAIIDAYEDLLVKIRAAHPHAEIICALGNMAVTDVGSVYPGCIDTAVARMNSGGDSKVYSLFFPYKGSGGHPIASEQLLMANQLTAYIRTNFSYLLPPQEPVKGGLLYKDSFDNDGLSVNTGPGGGLINKTWLATDWTDNGDLYCPSGDPGDRACVSSMNSFNLSEGFTLTVKWVGAVSENGNSFGLSTTQITSTAADNDWLGWGGVGGNRDKADIALKHAFYGIGFVFAGNGDITDPYDTGLKFNNASGLPKEDGSGQLIQLSDAQSWRTDGSTNTLVLAVEGDQYSYSINGAAATTGEIVAGAETFDLSQPFYFNAYSQWDATTITEVMLESMAEPVRIVGGVTMLSNQVMHEAGDQ